MRKIKRNMLVVIAYCALAVAILSVFTTIVGYTNSNGVHKDFGLVDFVRENGSDFDNFVSYEYTGQIYWTVDIDIIRLFTGIGVIAVICSFIGLTLISKQRESKASFILTMVGFAGTMAPSLLILVFLVVLRNAYEGTISCGIYPIVSPIAMILCFIAASQMRRRNKIYRKRLQEAEGLIVRGGDL